MTNYILSLDPGVSNGLALISYEADSAPQLVKGWQFTGGVNALVNWANAHWDGDGWDTYNDAPNIRGFYSWKMGVSGPLYVDSRAEYVVDGDDYKEVTSPANTTVICEKFTARSTKGFSYTTAALEPLRGEGAVIALGMMPDYKDLSAKKTRQHAFLKDSGFYLTNKDFPDSPAKDGADDFRSACSHGLAYLAREVKHKPTFEMIRNWTERNPA